MASLTRAGLVQIVKQLKDLAVEKGHRGGKLTSHDLCAIFTDRFFVGEDRTFYGSTLGFKFHPKERFHHCYSADRPSVIITYTWAGVCLDSDLPKFLDMADILIGCPDSNRTYWLDIFFNDQNNPNGIENDLRVADELYQSTRYHVVILFNRALQRGWCCNEVATRIMYVMEKEGLNEEQAAELMLNGDSRLPIPVIVQDLTDLYEDVWDGAASRLANMETSVKEDKISIRAKILKSMPEERFNLLMLLFRNSALGSHARRHPVQSWTVIAIPARYPWLRS